MQAYVSDYNIFIKSDVTAEAVQVTHNGKKNEILNGIPDWIYEGKLYSLLRVVHMLFQKSTPLFWSSLVPVVLLLATGTSRKKR